MLLASGTVYAQRQLEAFDDAGVDRKYEIGDTVEVSFLVVKDGILVSGVKLSIVSSGIGDVAISNNGITNLFGTVGVTGTILGEDETYIQAEWQEAQLQLRIGFTVNIEPSICACRDRC